MAYQKTLISTRTALKSEKDTDYLVADLDGNGTPDLVAITSRGKTPSGRVLVRFASQESTFQESRAPQFLSVFTTKDAADGAFVMQDWNADRRADLIFIKSRNTPNGKVEIHVADGKSGFTQIVNKYETGLAAEEDCEWAMTTDRDLVRIKSRNTKSNMVELQIVTRASKFKEVKHHVTGLAFQNEGVLRIGAISASGAPDLFYIKNKNTQSAMVEVHRLSASSGYKESKAFTTPLKPAEGSFWHLATFSHQEQPDLVQIRTLATPKNMVWITALQSMPVEPHTFLTTSRNLSFQGSVLKAELQRNDGVWKNAKISLRLFLGNVDGKFIWSGHDFQGTARNIRFEGTILQAELKKIDESWVPASFDFKDYLMNSDGVFQMINIPAVLVLSKKESANVLQIVEEHVQDPGFKLNIVNDQEDTAWVYGNRIIDGKHKDVLLFKTLVPHATDSVVRIAQKHGKSVEQTSAEDIGALSRGTILPSSGLDWFVTLVKGGVAVFDPDLGYGVESEVNIKNLSFVAESGGLGVSIGKHMSVTVFGNSIGIDLEHAWRSSVGAVTEHFLGCGGYPEVDKK